MNRGEVWLIDLGGRVGTRPVLILTRQNVLKYLNKDHNWAIGMAYQFYGIEIDYTGEFTRVDVEVNYQGPSVFVQYDF